MSGMTDKPAGWHRDPEDSTRTLYRYWDGDVWTEFTSPVGTPLPKAAPGERPCPYCTTMIPRAATRCASCAGEMRMCPHCGQNVGLTSRQKYVGIFRGGMKAQYGCMRCGKILDGPRF